MNNLNQNPKDISNLQIRYLIREHQEKMSSSWCSDKEAKIIVQSKPILQFTLDGVEWINVPTVTEKVK